VFEEVADFCVPHLSEQMSQPVVIEPSAEVVINGSLTVEFPIYDDSILNATGGVNETACLALLEGLEVVTVSDPTDFDLDLEKVADCARGEKLKPICSCEVSLSHFSTFATTDRRAVESVGEAVEEAEAEEEMTTEAEEVDSTPAPGDDSETDTEPAVEETTTVDVGDTAPDATEAESTEAVVETTPAPVEEFVLEVTTTLAGISKADFEAKQDAFISEIAKLFTGKTVDDITITDVREITTRRVLGRRLLATSVEVDYEVGGFESEGDLTAAKTTVESADSLTQLEEGLKAAGFDTLESITTEVTTEIKPAPGPIDSGADSLAVAPMASLLVATGSLIAALRG